MAGRAPRFTLLFIANWGDGGGNQRVPCGPCRLPHAYETPGEYHVELTVDDGITPPVSVVRVDLTDTTGAPSIPVTLFGPSSTCGGQTLQILG